MNKINYKFLSVYLLGALLLLQACKKDKVDFEHDNRVITENRTNSTARIINIAGYNQVVANGDSLTNFLVITPDPAAVDKYPGTSYFPVNGQLSKAWYVPQSLFSAQETAKLDFMNRVYQSTLLTDIKLDVRNDYNNPTDYFLMPTFAMNGQPEVVTVTRGVSAPSKPDHFKIRIINLSGAITYGTGQENLAGNVSLAYADGSLVNSVTNDISAAKKASEYIELPYGTYQFKLLTQDGRQIPAMGNEMYDFTVLDRNTSTIPVSFNNSSNLTYAPIQTYQPGGIYTIVIAPQRFKYNINANGETAETFQNSFQLINDNNAAANTTYFRLHAVNALNTQNISFKVDGKAIAANLGFGVAGEYSNFIQGNHTIEASDASGKTIATVDQLLRPAQNYTAWLYPDATGAAKLVLVANDLSGATYTGGTEDDASFARRQHRYYFFKRFLNLSIGNPYVTFTRDNGVSIANSGDDINAGVNLQPGSPLFERPYVSSSFSESAFQIMAYRSKPNVMPGIWANDIEVLKNDAFIAKKSLYQQAGRALPVQEPGIYTVSLIGRSGTGSTAENKARMIIVKHNK